MNNEKIYEKILKLSKIRSILNFILNDINDYHYSHTIDFMDYLRKNLKNSNEKIIRELLDNPNNKFFMGVIYMEEVSSLYFFDGTYTFTCNFLNKEKTRKYKKLIREEKLKQILK